MMIMCVPSPAFSLVPPLPQSPLLSSLLFHPLSTTRLRHLRIAVARRHRIVPLCSIESLSTVTGTGAPLQTYQLESSDGANINKATAFMISPDVFVTALHSLLLPLPPSSSLSSFLLADMNVDVHIQGQKMRFVRYSRQTDLALLSSSSLSQLTVLHDLPLLSCFSSQTTYTLPARISEDDNKSVDMDINPVDVIMKTCTSSGSLLPFVRCSFDRTSLSPHSFVGLSGSPIIRDDTGQVVGILIQGDEHYVEILAAPILNAFMKSDNQNLQWYHLKEPSINLQPLVHRFARQAYFDADDDDDDPLLPRVVQSYGDVHEDDLAFMINGYRVRIDACIEWNGLIAPAEVAGFSANPSIPVQVVREGQLVECQVDAVRATSPIKGSSETRMVSAGGIVFGVANVELLSMIALKQQQVGGQGHPLPQWLQSVEEDEVEDDDAEIVVVIGFDRSEGWTDVSAKGLEMERVTAVDGVKTRRLGQLVETSREWMKVHFANGFILKLPRGTSLENKHTVPNVTSS